MSTVLHPVGPQRARVYWVRRLLVILVVVALAAVATTAVSWLRGRDDPAAAAAGPAGGDSAAAVGSDTQDDEAAGARDADADAAAAGDADEEDAAAGEDEDAASSSTPVDCTPESLRVTLTSAAVEFDAASTPVFTATVTNVGDEPCTVDAGDATREVVVTSGEDRVWSTKDCATEGSASRQLLLGAGAADAVDIEWPRVRSAQDCPPDLPAPKPGTYQAVATLGDTTSQTVVFILG